MQKTFFFIAFAFAFTINGQINTSFYVDGRFGERLVFKDSLALTNHLAQRKIDWINRGYFFTGIDSILTESDDYIFFLHKGDRVTASVEGIRNGKFITGIAKKLKNFTNNGYPFASIIVDSVHLDNGQLTGNLLVNKGPEITYDSISFLGELKTAKSYIYKLVDVIPGERFNEDDYQRIDKKVRRSSFLRLTRDPDIAFKSNKAQIYLKMEENVSNSFEGILGLQENPNGGSSVVGSIDLEVQNLFNSAKEFSFFWERFAQSSQRLDLYYKHTFILDSKISPSFRFDLLKQDTTFITRTTGIGLNTYISNQTNLFLGYEGTNGSLIGTEVSDFQFQNLADYTRDFYEVALSNGNESDLSGLTKGLAWQVSMGLGNKRIRRNASLPDAYYDTIQLRTEFYRVDARLRSQYIVKSKQTIYHDLRLGLLDNDELLANELYRVGGLQSLRGFNEKNFFAEYFALSRLEFRSYFENQSFLYLFYDQLFYGRQNFRDHPFGLGLGFSLKTSSGQFNFALAGGSDRRQELSFSELRAHFGYVSRF